MRTAHLKRVFCMALLASPIVLTGCKSGMWKPTSMFAWGKDSPNATSDLELPVSPATKFTPNAIASVGAQGNTEQGTAATQKSPYGYTEPAAATGGLAARANGYTTGPYQMTANSTPVAETPGLSSTADFGAKAAQSATLPNPYGGTYPQNGSAFASQNSASTTTPNITLPQSVQQQLQAAKAASTSMPTMPSLPSPSTSASFLPAVGSTSPNTTLPSFNLGTPPTGSATTSSRQSSSNSSSTTLTPPSSSAYSSTPQVNLPSPSTSQDVGTFAPGTTARPTKYDFGN